MSARSVWLATVVALVSAAEAQEPAKFALAPVEQAARVQPAEAEVYYQGLTQACLARKLELQIVERRQLRLVRDELDLSASLGSEGAGQAYAAAAKGMKANRILVPAACKIDSDFLLSLRIVSAVDGGTKAFAIRKTRLTNRFASLAVALVAEVLGPAAAPAGEPATANPPAPVPAGEEESAVAFDFLRQSCKAASAPEFFPALWERAESIAKEGGKLNPACYYDALLHLSARAANPPGGMKFVPGGYVHLRTSAGPRKLWVEPFFLDGCETSVAEYLAFLAALEQQGDPQVLRECRSITLAHALYRDPAGPITGISFHAAQRCAAWRGGQLPTMLHWLRAAYLDQEDRPLPCGGEPAAASCNLAGAQDGFAVLAPVAQPGKDVSAAGPIGMTGNVREWTRTWYDKDAYARTPADDPREPEQGTMRVVMGGSWRTSARQAARDNTDKCRPGECMDDLGFRCMLPFFQPRTE